MKYEYDFGDYRVKNVKTFRGLEGEGFNASLYRGDKKVALVDDSAQGGECDHHWLDFEADRVDIQVTNHKGEPHTYLGTPEEKLFQEHVEALPRDMTENKDLWPDGYKVGDDTFIGQLVDDYESARRLRRLAKKKTLFITKDLKPGEMRTYNHPYDEEMKKIINDKYGDDVVEIINERFQ